MRGISRWSEEYSYKTIERFFDKKIPMYYLIEQFFDIVTRCPLPSHIHLHPSQKTKWPFLKQSTQMTEKNQHAKTSATSTGCISKAFSQMYTREHLGIVHSWGWESYNYQKQKKQNLIIVVDIQNSRVFFFFFFFLNLLKFTFF